jgi:prepilin-type N-terminal cleavage/methylation domain-containing protein
MIRPGLIVSRFFQHNPCRGGIARRSDCRSGSPVRSPAGFTLLEVLVTLTVLGVGVALTLTLISGSLRNVRRVQVSTRSIQHAETVLEMALLDDTIRRPTSLRGDFEDGTRWTVRIDEYVAPESAANAPRLTDRLPGGSTTSLPVRLFSYSVEVTEPESQAPDFSLQTLKLVNISESANPGGNTAGVRP